MYLTDIPTLKKTGDSFITDLRDGNTKLDIDGIKALQKLINKSKKHVDALLK